MPVEDWVTIGKILKPVGLQGEVKVGLLTDFPNRFDTLNEVTLLTQAHERLRFKIDNVRYGLPFVYLRFSELHTVEEVECLKGAYLQVPESERVALPKESYFHSDLIGLHVYTQDGECIGQVKEILEMGNNDMFVVRKGTDESLIPAIKKFVLAIDLERKRMDINVIEGLLDL